MIRSKTLCMAPWTHTYLSPQTERRMCCASREPAQNFEQYIDTNSGTGKYIPITLEEHWNGDHMRSVRRRMMAGETLPECEVCNDQLLNTDVYRSYFNHLFARKYKRVSFFVIDRANNSSSSVTGKSKRDAISEEEGSIPGSGMACSASGSIFEANFPPSIGIKVRYRYKFLAVTKP